MSYSRRWSALGLPVAILMILAVLAVSVRVSAQGDPSHPAHIHQGTCAELGDIVAPLDNVSFAEAAQLSGSDAAIPVKFSETEVELSLDDILADEHAINIHESADNIQEYIACGDIGGPVRGGQLVIGLGQLNASGHTGVAILEEAEGGTNVTVYLIEPIGEAAATDDAADDDAADDAADDDAATDDTDDAATDDTDDAATDDTDDAADEADDTDTAAAPAGQEITVDIQNFAFNPDPIEIAVGDTVTWTNQDGVPHTATGQNRDQLQSGTIAPGASFSQTFTEAGEIAYFCEFHPNMNGTIIVQ
ncbi:MAG: cupredoxin family copper-binding protein [Chloroflexota bacterium]|nr:cupredoxin family copper-binding protein [Chloroflexota bacterium]